MTPALSPSELATVARFDAAPDPFCDCCDGAGQVCAVPVGAAVGALIPCPLCAGTGDAA